MMTQAIDGAARRPPSIVAERQARMVAGALNSHGPMTEAFQPPRAGMPSNAGLAVLRVGRRIGAGWLVDALAQVDRIDREAAEEGYPAIGEAAKRGARRLLFIASTSSLEPAVYPSMDGEIGIYFKSPVAPAALLILLDGEGGAGCYWSLHGKSQRKRYDDSSKLPANFVRTQLQALGGSTLSQTVE